MLSGLLAILGGCRMDPAGVFEAVSPSVVIIWASDSLGEPLGQGSGVVLEDSQVVTNCHVVDEASGIQVSWDQDTAQAVLLARDGERDLCLLQMRRSLGIAATRGSSSELKIGHRVYTVGAPVGMELTIGEGILSGFRVFDSVRYLQTTAPISPGSSGGGLWDEQGRLLGITSFYEEYAQNVNFAAPVEWIDQIRTRSETKVPVRKTTEWKSRAQRFMQARDWMGLKEWSRAWCLAEPDNAQGWYARGMAAFGLGEARDTAVHSLRRALQLNERFGEAWEILALVWGRADSLGLELQHHERAVSFMPQSAKAWFNLGACAFNLGLHARAEHAFRMTLSLEGEDARASARLGLVLMRLGRLEEGRGWVDSALRKDSLDPEIHRIQAVVHLGRGDLLRADSSWRRVVEGMPQDWMAWHNLGVHRYMQGRMQQAILAFEEAIRLEPGDEAAWYGLASARSARGGPDRGVETLQKALATSDSSAFLWRSLGEFALESRQAQLAWDACRKATRKEPRDGLAWACRAEAAHALGKYPQARADGRMATHMGFPGIKRTLGE